MNYFDSRGAGARGKGHGRGMCRPTGLASRDRLLAEEGV